jgi:hypothetical protein
MRLGCIAVLAGLYLIWSGVHGLWTAVRNREPFEVSCRDYADRKPTKEWLRLTGCTMSLMEASYTENGGKATEIFLPARGAQELEGTRAHVLVATKDGTLLSVANQLLETKDEAALMRYALDHHEQILSTRDIEGLVRRGVDLDDEERTKLESLDATLAEDFVILDEGRTPGVMGPLGLFAGGAVLLFFSAFALAPTGAKS